MVPEDEGHNLAVYLPGWMYSAIDEEAKRLGTKRAAVVKTWLAEKIDKLKDEKKSKE